MGFEEGEIDNLGKRRDGGDGRLCMFAYLKEVGEREGGRGRETCVSIGPRCGEDKRAEQRHHSHREIVSGIKKKKKKIIADLRIEPVCTSISSK